MKHFETMIARYNATLPTIGDEKGQELQLTERGILLVTMKDDDGADVIVSTGEDVSSSGDRGFIAYGIDANETAQPMAIDPAGLLKVNVADGSIDVDFTPGVDFDTGCDEAGVNPEPGILAGITQSYQDVVTIPIPNGKTYAVAGFDATCDSQGMFQLVFENNTGSSYVRTMVIPENLGFNQLAFPRAREFSALDENTSLTLKGKCLRQGRSMDASGGINAYEKTDLTA